MDGKARRTHIAYTHSGVFKHEENINFPYWKNISYFWKRFAVKNYRLGARVFLHFSLFLIAIETDFPFLSSFGFILILEKRRKKKIRFSCKRWIFSFFLYEKIVCWNVSQISWVHFEHSENWKIVLSSIQATNVELKKINF